MLRDRFDVVVDFYESAVPEVNYDQELEHQVEACVQRHAPFLHVSSQKDWNTFLYQRFDVESRRYADALGLDRQRVENVYETTFRLIAELGLPLRLGEESPAADSVLAGLPWPEAEAAWSALLEQNTQRRPGCAALSVRRGRAAERVRRAPGPFSRRAGSWVDLGRVLRGPAAERDAVGISQPCPQGRRPPGALGARTDRWRWTRPMGAGR